MTTYVVAVLLVRRSVVTCNCCPPLSTVPEDEYEVQRGLNMLGMSVANLCYVVYNMYDRIS